MTDIYLHCLCEHYGLYGNAPVLLVSVAAAGGATATAGALFLSRTSSFGGEEEAAGAPEAS